MPNCFGTTRSPAHFPELVFSGAPRGDSGSWQTDEKRKERRKSGQGLNSLTDDVREVHGVLGITFELDFAIDESLGNCKLAWRQEHSAQCAGGPEPEGKWSVAREAGDFLEAVPVSDREGALWRRTE